MLLLFLRRGRRRRHRQPDPERMENAQSFSDLAGFFALFEVDDEAQACSRGQGQVFLSDAEALTGIPDLLADLLWRRSHVA
jgi:hypothetical protein